MGHSCCNNNLKDLFDHALALQKKQDFAGAQEHYQQIVEKYPEHTESHYNLAYVLSQQQQFTDAITQLEMVVKQQPCFAPAYFNLAINHLAKQETQEAMQSLENVLHYDPAHINAEHLLGCLYLEQKNYEEATMLLASVNKRAPNDAEILHNLGLAYLGLNELTQARTSFISATKYDPHLFEAFYNLGVIHGVEREFDLAVTAYEKCLEINPEYYPAVFNLGRLYHDARNVKKAREYYLRAQALAPDNQNSEYLLAAIDNTATSPAVTPPQYVMELFDSYANYYDKAMQQQLDYATPKLLRETITPWLAQHTAEIDILDLGCGTGLVGEAFADVANKLIGIDLSANMLIHAQQKGCYTQLETAEIVTYLRRHSLPFDMIIAADVFLYFGDLNELFEQATKLLKSKGVLGFSVETQNNNDTFLLQISARFAHNPQYIEKLADKYKLKIIVNEVANLRKHENEFIKGQIFWLEKE